MARAHEPQNGSDHPHPNGIRGRQVAIALFIATTFGIMAILSFPVSRIARLPLRLPHPLEAALSPIERLIRPVIPWLGGPSRGRTPRVSVALAPQQPGGANPVTAPGPPSSGGPGTPPQPPGEGPRPTLTRTGPEPVRTLATILVTQLTTILSNGTKTLSPEQARLIQAEVSALRSMRSACMADTECAALFRLVEKLLHRLEAHQRGRHGGEHGNRGGKHGAASGSSHESEGTSPGRGHRHRPAGSHEPRGNGAAASGHSHQRHEKRGKHGKRHG